MTRRAFVLTFLLANVVAAHVCADGGMPRRTLTSGEYQITVFTEPTPLRAGPIDLSTWVQQADSGGLAPAEIQVTATHRASGQVIHAQATRAAATNKLLQAALFELPTAGLWSMQVEVRPLVAGAGSAAALEPVAIEVDVAERLPRWREVAGWILWPLVPIGLFAAHHCLSKRTRRTCLRASGGTS